MNVDCPRSRSLIYWMSRKHLLSLISIVMVVIILSLLLSVILSGGEDLERNVVLICAIVDAEGRRELPLRKIVFDHSGVDSGFRLGEDMSQFGVTYNGPSGGLYPDQLVVVFWVSRDEKSNRLRRKLLETYSVIGGKIPTKNNQSLADFEKNLASKREARGN